MLSRLLSPVCVKCVPLTVTRDVVNRPTIWALLPRKYSSTAGFFFCGMMLEVLATRSGNARRPNSGVDHT
jgi:hypothetical protein